MDEVVKPQDSKSARAYGDLCGAIGQWMDAHDQERHYTIYYLTKCIAELDLGRHCNYAWRLRRLEQVLELPENPVSDDALSEFGDDWKREREAWREAVERQEGTLPYGDAFCFAQILLAQHQAHGTPLPLDALHEVWPEWPWAMWLTPEEPA